SVTSCLSPLLQRHGGSPPMLTSTAGSAPFTRRYVRTCPCANSARIVVRLGLLHHWTAQSLPAYRAITASTKSSSASQSPSGYGPVETWKAGGEWTTNTIRLPAPSAALIAASAFVQT